MFSYYFCCGVHVSIHCNVPSYSDFLFVALWFNEAISFTSVCLTLCHFVLVFFSPLSIAITSLGEERTNLSPVRTFVRFVLVWICRFPLPLGVWEGLRFVIVALPWTFLHHENTPI